MKTRVSLKYFVNDCLWKHFFSSNSTQTTLNLISLIVFVTLRPFTQKVSVDYYQQKVKARFAWLVAEKLRNF